MFHRCCLEILSILTLKLCFVQSPRGQWSLCQGPGEQLCFQTSWDEFSVCSYPQYLERGPLTASLHSGAGGSFLIGPHRSRGLGTDLGKARYASHSSLGRARWQPPPPALVCQGQEEAHSQLHGGLSPIPNAGTGSHRKHTPPEWSGGRGPFQFAQGGQMRPWGIKQGRPFPDQPTVGQASSSWCGHHGVIKRQTDHCDLLPISGGFLRAQLLWICLLTKTTVPARGVCCYEDLHQSAPGN